MIVRRDGFDLTRPRFFTAAPTPMQRSYKSYGARITTLMIVSPLRFDCKWRVGGIAQGAE